MLRELYITNLNRISDMNRPDVVLWKHLHKLVGQNSPMVDRCGVIQMPYNLKLYNKFKMPRDFSEFNLSYEDCCNIQAQELIDLSRRLDKKITIMYSGGIDSTLVVVSFMKLLSSTEFKNRIDIALSNNSIAENSNFYYNFIRPVGNIVASDNLHNMFDSSTIIVGGEHNDQVFGSDLIGRAANSIGGFAEMHKPYSREHVVGFLKSYGNMSQEAATFFFELINEHIKQAPCEITTNYHFWWWLNFSFKWQNVFFRMLLRARESQRANINQEFVDNYFHHFFSGTNFQKWSMLNHNLKVMDSWKTYKWEAKRLIYEFNKDADYRDNKVKIGSLVEIFRQRKLPVAITSEYEFLTETDSEEFYVPNNSFII